MLRKIRAAWLVAFLLLLAGSLPVQAGGGGGAKIGVLFAGLDDGRLYRSLDDGASWQPTKHHPGDDLVYAIAIAGNLIFAGTENGLYRSADGGDTWEGVADGSIHGVAIDPVHPNIVYAVDDLGQFLRSTDAGLTWSTTTLPVFDVGADGMVIDPARPSILAVWLHGWNDTPQDENDMLVSTDSGHVWHKIPGLPSSMVEALFVKSVTYDPINPLTAYAATEYGLYRSTDGGLTWHAWGLDQDLTDMVIDPTNHLHFAATGPYFTYASQDGGEHWSKSSAPLSNVYTLVVDVAKPSTLIGTTAISGDPLHISYDGGNVWQTVPKPFPVPTADMVMCVASGWL